MLTRSTDSKPHQLLHSLVEFFLNIRKSWHETLVYQLNEFDISCVNLAYSPTESLHSFCAAKNDNPFLHSHMCILHPTCIAATKIGDRNRERVSCQCQTLHNASVNGKSELGTRFYTCTLHCWFKFDAGCAIPFWEGNFFPFLPLHLPSFFSLVWRIQFSHFQPGVLRNGPQY